MINNALYSSKTDDWATPQRLFDELNRTFHFTLDVCASKENAKCTKYFTKEQDGLKQDWGGLLFGATHHMGEKSANGCKNVQNTKELQSC